MSEIFNFEKFLYTYLIFVFFLVFMFSLPGTAEYFADVSGISTLSAPTPPTTPDTTGNGIIDFFTSVATSGVYFFENVAFFFTLMTVNSSIQWLGILVFSPAIVFLIRGVMKHLIRG